MDGLEADADIAGEDRPDRRRDERLSLIYGAADAAIEGDWRGRNLAADVLRDWHLDQGDDEVKADLARTLTAMLRGPGNCWPTGVNLAGSGLSDHQREQWSLASASPLAILVGTPGTGKTHTAAAVIRHLMATNQRRIAMCAPTGKAAVRLQESMRRQQVHGYASTIHTLLGITRNGHDGQGWGFRYGPGNPLPYRFLIVDEVSMLDTSLAASLFSAVAPGTHVLLLGDPHQLPPVGHGAPLRDMLAAGLPHGRLTEVRRNAGMIVQACALIKDGRDWPFNSGQPTAVDNLCHWERHDTEQVVGTVVSLARTMCDMTEVSGFVHDLLRSNLADDVGPEWGVQVITATNAMRRRLNAELQATLNPGLSVPGCPYRPGDKVICLRNSWHLAEGGQDTYLANGEMGMVLAVYDQHVTAGFNGTVVRVPYGRQARPVSEGEGQGEEGEVSERAGSDFDLGWAITTHKSQGGEWGVVIIAIDDSAAARRISGKEWLYTAISRASGCCFTVGRLSAARMFARRSHLAGRKTFMTELLSGS